MKLLFPAFIYRDIATLSIGILFLHSFSLFAAESDDCPQATVVSQGKLEFVQVLLSSMVLLHSFS